MRKTMRMLCRPKMSKGGQSAVEYALLLAMFGLVAAVAVVAVGTHTKAAMGDLAMQIQVSEAPADAAPAPSGGNAYSMASLQAAAAPEKAPPRPVLYKVKKDGTADELARLNAVLKQYDLRVEKKIVKGSISRGRAMGQEAPAVGAVCAALLATGAVEFAEEDRLVQPAAVPDDPLYVSQWHHVAMGSPEAWDITTGSRSVVVAVCDTGVQSDHPDLAANLQLPGHNTADNSTNTEPVLSHGTQVAGCIGAVGCNGTGVSGVNWHVSILPIRVTNMTNGTAYVSDIAEGVVWAADHGAKVANISFDCSDLSTIASAGQYLRDRGGLLFVAAGNSGSERSFPDFPSFLAVGATTSADTLASFSSYGTYVDLVAPGSSIYTTTTGGGYSRPSGTSDASPVAAGVAALVFAANPSLSNTEVESILLRNCVDLGEPGDDSVYGHGRVDAGAAVAEAAGVAHNIPPIAYATASPTSGTAPLAVGFDGGGSTDSDGTIVSYAWNFGDGAGGTGTEASHTYTAAGVFTAKLTVTDDGGDSATDTVQVTVEAVNVPPTASAAASPTSGEAPLAVTFDGRASADSDGTIASYSWNFGDGSAATGSVVSHTYRAAGMFAATLTVTDDDGASATDTAQVTVEASTQPIAVATASPLTGTAPLDVAFDGSGSSDPNGTIASYAWSFGDGLAGSGAAASHTYEAAGVFTATLTVTDNDGATGTDTVQVTVEAPNVPPVAAASASPSTGTAPLQVAFNGTGSSDPDGTIASYAWDFGDGSAGSGVSVSHTYGAASTFTATLTVTDNDGATAADTVQVTAVPPTAISVASISLAAQPTHGGTVVVATVLIRGAGGPVPNALVSGTWDGIVNGSSTGETGPDGTVTLQSSKTRSLGTATLTVTDVSGQGYAYDPTANVVTSGSVVLQDDSSSGSGKPDKPSKPGQSKKN